MAKMQQVKAFLLKPGTLLAIYILVTLIASIHLLSLGKSHFIEGKLYGQFISGQYYTHYNNYVIFKNSFYNLTHGKDLYILYLDEQWDLYKYSPTFALAMGALAWLPDFIGLCIWNLVNALSLYFAIRMLPLDDKKHSYMLWFILLELLTSLQSSQSNALLAAMMIGALGFMERGKPQWATLLLVGATFIKVYGAAGFVLFFFYPGKPKFIAYAILWTVLMAIAPLVVISPAGLAAQYQSWVNMMSMDQSFSYGFSIMGWLHSWFGITKGTELVIGVGLILFFLPFLRLSLYRDSGYRILFLAFMLVWVIIFNHKAESSTFIIAITGAAIWYFSKAVHQTWEAIVLALIFLFSCLSPTDLFPHPIRQMILVPYVVKVVPCILLWCVMLVELLRFRPTVTYK
jgi:hypothetical protein